ncbi:MAG TPA: hypothetical protein VFA60_03510 [Terriglobales bacterium]|jgi:hypothetical protein|nr:hypothetical protein [Terriglobales bacterium]
MRFRNLALLTACMLVLAGAVVAAGKPATASAAPQVAAPSTPPEYDSRQERDLQITQPAANFRMPAAADLDRLRRTNPEAYRQFMKRRWKLMFSNDNTCYTMHTFYYDRVNGGDAMQRVGETTCTPSNRFQLHEAGPQ